MNDVISFSYNWNNKLDCHAFTTIRPRNDLRFIKGAVFKITAKGEYIFSAQLVDVKHFRLNSMNDFMAYIDTGYSADNARSIIKNMYPDYDFDNKDLSYLLLIRIK